MKALTNKILISFCTLFILYSINANASRKEISLNGMWKIAKTGLNSTVPTSFISEVLVPGLVDMAVPPLEKVPVFSEKTDTIIPDESLYYNDALYWYKKNFTIDDSEFDRVQLKINKAMYHTTIYLNGKKIADNPYNFTPTYANLKSYLRKPGVENELIVSVGCRNNLPDTVVRGDDMEKFYFYPGIYDEVKLIMSDYPFIENIQTAPDIEKSQLRVQAEILRKGAKKPINLSYIVKECISKKVIASGIAKNIQDCDSELSIADFTIPLTNYNLWSPETPFLYEIELTTEGDKAKTKFGMRSFKTDSERSVMLLNGKPYYMRGTNVLLFRFFEDDKRGTLPWDKEWISRLFTSYKDMHWNSFRFHLGVPPECWYELADSLGFLVQDEYPIWKGQKPKPDGLTTLHLANEYRERMRERWNHPCVVIWDGQNETVTDSTAIAINKVRALDLSNRPWDNGWAPPASEGDVIESHPYLFFPYYVALKKNVIKPFPDGVLNTLFKEPQSPGGPNFKSKTEKTYKNPIIINEFSWMWLNRNGTTTAATDAIYKTYFPEADTNEKRLELLGKFQGMEIEYWRSHRRVAGVLEYCGLNYSRTTPPLAITSDNLSADIESATFNSYFYQYVRPAYSPVGIMIDMWDQKLKSGAVLNFPVNIINDTYTQWNGEIYLSILKDGRKISEQTIKAEVLPVGKSINKAQLTLPAENGKYKLVAGILYGGEEVKSVREFVIE